MIGHSLRLTVAGVVLGVAGAALATRVLTHLLFGVGPMDPVTFTAVALIFLLVACLAAWLPARRAMRLDPVATLRGE